MLTETSLVSRRQGGQREWVAEVGKPGRRLLQLPVSCNQGLAGGMDRSNNWRKNRAVKGQLCFEI